MKLCLFYKGDILYIYIYIYKGIVEWKSKIEYKVQFSTTLEKRKKRLRAKLLG